ncbi:MAG: cytochrome c family protein [Nitrospirae bacterium]|nr:cytochrome c family protein [Nitrospirota bacterium]MCL5238403.1 cytochrome c family protein [Nitrospirota bacterium]
MFNPFTLLKRIIAWFNEGISARARMILITFALLFFVGMGLIGYKINDYFENDPNACLMCHVHDKANKAWAHSVHKTVNCHECHHSTKKDQVIQMYRFAVLGQRTVSPRHGAIIVAWKICIQCHWERNSKYPNAPLVNHSRYHAKHVFIEQIECSKCHGYITHQFLPEERFCLKCHKDREVHGTGMEKLACLNCHTDRTKDLKPGRTKCLFCHGGEQIRKQLIADGTIDVKYFQPSSRLVKKAIKINVPADAPMQFYCYVCHKPHAKVKPDMGDCLKCHKVQPGVGKHGLHIKMMNMKCMDCHKPHVWRITQAQAKKDCIKCHEYRDPKKFIGS